MAVYTHVSFETEDSALQKLYDTALQKCQGNLRLFGGSQVLVEGGGYEKIWLETQPMGGEMYAPWNPTAALNNQLLFMRAQRADGRLPGSIQCLADGTLVPQFDKFQGFCFPYPALNMYYWTGRDSAYLEELAQCLRRFDEYLWRARDSNGDGLLESWCVFDTGEDRAVRYGDAPDRWTEETPPQGYAVVPMASMDFMSFSYACRDTLAQISALRGDGQEAHWRQQAAQVARAIREKLWDDQIGACFDRDRHGRPVPVLSHNSLRCMYWGSFSQDMAARFVKEHLLNPREFWTDMPLPSVSVSDPAFRNAPENNWSGQAEGLTYQRAVLALERYGFETLVPRLGRRLMRAVIEGGYTFTQQFDPFTGAPSRVGMTSHLVLGPDSDEPFQDAYGPTILSVLNYIAHMWGVAMDRGRMLFSLCRADRPYAYELTWNERTYRVESDGEKARVLLNGRQLAESACGRRLITDEAGNPLAERALEA